VVLDSGYILVAPASKSALNNRINELKNTTNNNYTAASWQAFQNALTNAQTIAAKNNATQTEVDNALTALNATYSALTQNPPPEPVKYVGIFGLQTKYEATLLNWLLFILGGFIWMWF